MNPTTISRLLELNRQFYQTFALPFSATRQRLQPGVLKILEQINPEDDLLDLGCGNGELAHELARCGHAGSYTGLDFSPPLLGEASLGQPSNFRFILADLSGAHWDADLTANQFDAILAFAVLHHLPGIELRSSLLRKVRSLLKPGGRFIHSEWQFLNSPRLAARVQPWKAIELADEEVDPGDYLLDWRQGGTGLRYVHLFSEQELVELAAQVGFQVAESFLSDGETHNLGMYQVWK
ncbi:MAG TPA: class I SAM-dependent methyltransferase [Anaerolineales bacterium]|nr:class I SAM-dependent methyltransferase [Anaerolineales bacterium]